MDMNSRISVDTDSSMSLLVAHAMGVCTENPICRRLWVFVQRPLTSADVEKNTTETA